MEGHATETQIHKAQFKQQTGKPLTFYWCLSFLTVGISYSNPKSELFPDSTS